LVRNLCMSFAGLQVCFPSIRPKTHDFSIEWNKRIRN
jgi:hypothetical protein